MSHVILTNSAAAEATTNMSFQVHHAIGDTPDEPIILDEDPEPPESIDDKATTRFSSFKRASPQIEGTLRKFALRRQPSNDHAIELVKDDVTIIQRNNFLQSLFKLNVSVLQAEITIRDVACTL